MPKRKERITVSIDPDLADWVRMNIGPGKRFGSFTHAVESGLVQLRAE